MTESYRLVRAQGSFTVHHMLLPATATLCGKRAEKLPLAVRNADMYAFTLCPECRKISNSMR